MRLLPGDTGYKRLHRRSSPWGLQGNRSHFFWKGAKDDLAELIIKINNDWLPPDEESEDVR